MIPLPPPIKCCQMFLMFLIWNFFCHRRVSKINNDNNNNNNNKFYLSFPSVIYIYIIEYIALLSILNFSVEQMIAVFYHDI